MGNKSKIAYKRGLFFIQNGNAKHFNMFHAGSQGVVKYIPNFMIRRIEDLMKIGDKDRAVTLWLKACENADKVPMKIRKNLLHIMFHIIIGSMALYAFLHVLDV